MSLLFFVAEPRCLQPTLAFPSCLITITVSTFKDNSCLKKKKLTSITLFVFHPNYSMHNSATWCFAANWFLFWGCKFKWVRLNKAKLRGSKTQKNLSPNCVLTNSFFWFTSTLNRRSTLLSQRGNWSAVCYRLMPQKMKKYKYPQTQEMELR